jgi:hypothetical protein
MSSENLDPVLKKHLSRVEAPANLWSQVRGARAVPNQARASWMTTWATVAAAFAVVAGGWTMWNQLRTPLTVEAMAIAALDRNPEDLTLRTEDAASIRKWVKTNSGIDIPLPPKHASVIRIQGARVSGETNRMAEISYQVGEFRAALLVTKNPSGATAYPKHDFRGSDAFQAARVTSWSLKGQSYTLAWSAPDESRTPCLLCHDQAPPMLPPTAMVN